MRMPRLAVAVAAAAAMASQALATVTVTASRADTLYTTDTQFDCGKLARSMDADLPYNVVRIRAEDDTGQATSFQWKLPKPDVGFLLPDDPEIESSSGGAFAVRGFCAEFGSGCVLTKASIRTYQRPTILWAAPTCESIPDDTRRPFDGDTVRIRVTAKSGKRRLGKGTTDVSYGMLGTPTLFASVSADASDDGLGKMEVVTGVNPVFSVLLDPAIAASTPSPIKEWFIDNGEGGSVRTDRCSFTGSAIPTGAQACAQIQYQSGGRFVARTEVRLEDDSAYCDKLRVRVGQCRGTARVNIRRDPKKRTYASGDVVDFAVEFHNTSPRHGCTFGFESLRCDATFTLGKLEEKGSTTFVLPRCKEDTSLLCGTDADCVVLGVDRGPCLVASHCSETTEQQCSSDIDCRTAACPACRPHESCIRVLALSPELARAGIPPGASVTLFEDTVPLQSVLPGKAKIAETWTVDTVNLASFSGKVAYKIRGNPPQ